MSEELRGIFLVGILLGGPVWGAAFVLYISLFTLKDKISLAARRKRAAVSNARELARAEANTRDLKHSLQYVGVANPELVEAFIAQGWRRDQIV